MNPDFPNLKIYDFDSGSDKIDLHAKIIGVDNNTVIIGSSNLSKRGHVSNYEMGVVLKGETATRIIRGCYSLINSNKVKLIG
jgi:cardiolipin synthase